MDPECLVPGKNGEPVSRIGSIIERQGFEQMKDEYYRIRDWDLKTGLPVRESLKSIDLEDVADDLEKRGILT